MAHTPHVDDPARSKKDDKGMTEKERVAAEWEAKNTGKQTEQQENAKKK